MYTTMKIILIIADILTMILYIGIGKMELGILETRLLGYHSLLLIAANIIYMVYFRKKNRSKYIV